MPSEYYPYVYLFCEETVEGFAKSLSDILELPNDILLKKGNSAKKFVLQYKNNKIQVSKILDMIISNFESTPKSL